MVISNPNKRSGISTWLLSLVVLLSGIGFSVTPPLIGDQKQTETEVNVSRNQLAKKGSSFNRLRSDLMTRNFLNNLNNVSVLCSVNQLNNSLIEVFKSADHTFDSIPTPDDLFRFCYRARSTDDLGTAKG